MSIRSLTEFLQSLSDSLSWSALVKAASCARRFACQHYLTCIRPSLEYVKVACCGLTKRDRERLEKCNRSAARLIMRTMPSSDIPHDFLLARAGIPTLLSRRQVARVKLAFTATRGLLPAHLQATGLCPVHPMRWPNAIHLSVYHDHGKTPNGSRHSTLLFLCGTLFQQNYRDQRALIPCSFSYRLTLSHPWPVVACCDRSIPVYVPIPIPPRLSHSQ